MNAEELEELKRSMMTLIEEDESLAGHIGLTSREVADYMLADDDENELNPKQRNNYAIFFCIGAAWAITQNINSIK